MNKVFHFLMFSLRLFFLSLIDRRIRRKLQATFLIVSYSALMYAVFLVSIQPSRSRLRTADDYGKEEALLDLEQRRLNSIIFKAARHAGQNMITIERSDALAAEEKRKTMEAASAISLDDRFFLLQILTRLKDSTHTSKE